MTNRTSDRYHHTPSRLAIVAVVMLVHSVTGCAPPGKMAPTVLGDGGMYLVTRTFGQYYLDDNGTVVVARMSNGVTIRTTDEPGVSTLTAPLPGVLQRCPLDVECLRLKPQFPAPEVTAPPDTPLVPKYIEYRGVDMASVLSGAEVVDVRAGDVIGMAHLVGQEPGVHAELTREVTIAVIDEDDRYVDPFLYWVAGSTSSDVVMRTDGSPPAFGTPGIGLVLQGQSSPLPPVNAPAVAGENAVPRFEVTDVYDILADVHDAGPVGLCYSQPCGDILGSATVGVKTLSYEIAPAAGSAAALPQEPSWATTIHCIDPDATTVADIYHLSTGAMSFLYNLTRMRTRTESCLDGTGATASSASTASLNAADLDPGRDYLLTITASDYAGNDSVSRAIVSRTPERGLTAWLVSHVTLAVEELAAGERFELEYAIADTLDAHGALEWRAVMHVLNALGQEEGVEVSPWESLAEQPRGTFSWSGATEPGRYTIAFRESSPTGMLLPNPIAVYVIEARIGSVPELFNLVTHEGFPTSGAPATLVEDPDGNGFLSFSDRFSYQLGYEGSLDGLSWRVSRPSQNGVAEEMARAKAADSDVSRGLEVTGTIANALQEKTRLELQQLAGTWTFELIHDDASSGPETIVSRTFTAYYVAIVVNGDLAPAAAAGTVLRANLNDSNENGVPDAAETHVTLGGAPQDPDLAQIELAVYPASVTDYVEIRLTSIPVEGYGCTTTYQPPVVLWAEGPAEGPARVVEHRYDRLNCYQGRLSPYKYPEDPTPSEVRFIEGLDPNRTVALKLGLTRGTYDYVREKFTDQWLIYETSAVFTTYDLRVVGLSSDEQTHDRAVLKSSSETVTDAATLRAVGHLDIALWESTFKIVSPPDVDMYYAANSLDNSASTTRNFVDRDPRRFYVRVTDRAANTDPNARDTITVSLETRTGVDDSGNGGSWFDDPTDLMLTESGEDSSVFVSAAQILTCQGLPGVESPPLDDDLAVHDGNSAVADNQLGDRTHKVYSIDDWVRVVYRPAGDEPARIADVPVCSRQPEGRRTAWLRIHVFQDPFQDIGYGAAQTGENDGEFSWDDSNENGVHDLGEDSEPYLNASLGETADWLDPTTNVTVPGFRGYRPAILSDGDSREPHVEPFGTVMTRDEILADIEAARVSWAQACVDVKWDGNVQVHQSKPPWTTTSGYSRWEATPYVVYQVLKATMNRTTLDVFYATKALPEIDDNEPVWRYAAHAFAPSNTAFDHGEDSFIFIWGNYAASERTLAHELGHIFTNMDHIYGSSAPGEEPPIFFPPPSTNDSAGVLSTRRLTADVVTNAHRERCEQQNQPPPIDCRLAPGNTILVPR